MSPFLSAKIPKQDRNRKEQRKSSGQKPLSSAEPGVAVLRLSPLGVCRLPTNFVFDQLQRQQAETLGWVLSAWPDNSDKLADRFRTFRSLPGPVALLSASIFVLALSSWAMRSARGLRASGAELKLRHDHGSNYMSGDFRDEIKCLGIEASPSVAR